MRTWEKKKVLQNHKSIKEDIYIQVVVTKSDINIICANHTNS